MNRFRIRFSDSHMLFVLHGRSPHDRSQRILRFAPYAPGPRVQQRKWYDGANNPSYQPCTYFFAAAASSSFALALFALLPTSLASERASRSLRYAASSLG